MEDNVQPKKTEPNTKKGNNKPKYVVGTASSVNSGRKMRAPPADIFIWGVHPATTPEDIVNDLAESEIKIEVNDIVKKSKDDAPLNSYKISVPAQDLTKALDPSVWPLRVKVREYIYYPKKRDPKQKSDQSKTQPSEVSDTAAKQSEQQGQVSGHEVVVSPEVTLANRYDALSNNDGEPLP